MLESIQRKRLAKKMWDSLGEHRQEAIGVRLIEVAKGKEKACRELYVRLNTNE